jgi:hypothetical protein
MNALHELLKQLSPSERRYVHLQLSAARSDSLLLQVFETMGRTGSVRDEDLLSVLSEVKNVQRLRALEHKLYQSILRHMRSYHAQSTISARIGALFGEVEFLFEKKLYRHCERHLAKIEKLAQDNHLTPAEWLVQDWRLRLYENRTFEEKEELRSREVARNMERLADALSSETEYKSLWLNFRFVTDTKYKHLTEEERKIFFRNLQQHRLLRAEQVPTAYHARVHYFTLNSTSSYYANRFEESIHFETELLEMLRASPGQELRKVLLHLDCLANLLTLTKITRRYDDFYGYLGEMRALPDRYPSFRDLPVVRDRIETDALVHELDAEQGRGNIDRAIPLAVRLESLFAAGDGLGTKSLRNWAVLVLAEHYFLIGDCAMALRWNQRLLNAPNPRQSGYYQMARVQELKIHFELGNRSVLGSVLRSLYRYLLHGQEGPTMFDRHLLSFIRSVAQARSQKETIQLMRKFYTQLQPLADMVEREFAGLHIIPWLESRLTGTHVLDILRQRN